MIFKTNSSFQSLAFDSHSWRFLFADKIHASSTGFWRLLEANKIKFVSLDQGQQFGLPKPLDLTKEVSSVLTGKKLLEIKVDDNTADLTLTLSGGIKIEIYIASSGYESYEFVFEGKRYVGLGAGSIAIVEI